MSYGQYVGLMYCEEKEMKWKEGEDMTERDARDLVDWLDQAEEETKSNNCRA